MDLTKAKTLGELLAQLNKIAESHNIDQCKWYGFDDGLIVIEDENGLDMIAIESGTYDIV